MSARIVLFDVMDTLVHDPFRHEMPTFFGMTLEEMLAAKHRTAWIEFETEARDEASFLRDFFADGRPFDHEGFRRAVFGGYRLIAGIESILAALRARGVAMHAASNYPTWWNEIEARTRLSRYLEWSFVSCRLGVRKPDPAFFDAITNELGAPPASCTFVDDQPRNCDAARALGFDVIRFEGVAALEDALRARSLLG